MIHLIGIKKELDLVRRGQLSISPESINGILIKMRQVLCTEVVIINTCNRTEIYLKSHLKKDDLISKIFNILKWNLAFKEHIFYSNENKAINHLFEVSCGFHSKILGEDQILGQVKDSYLRSKNLKVIKGNFDKLFSMAISCGKEFKTQSKLYKMPVSYSSIAAKKALENNCKNILILGFGKMAELTFNYLIGKIDFITSITIVVRNTSKVNEHPAILKNAHYVNLGKLIIKPLSDLCASYANMDAIICCTSSPTPLVMKNDLQTEKVMIFDLSLPINVEASCVELKNVDLYNVDTLQNVDNENKILRKEIMNSNKYIISKYYDEYIKYLKLKSLSPIIENIKCDGNLVVQNNLKTFRNKKYTKDNDKLVATLLKSSSNTYINRAIEVLKEETLNGDNKKAYDLIQRIFLK
ncbi:MAG: glutamyl-tRNA reductase [Clostridium sp.]|uniref:glutamyl-tRNA reductase n=1 Tax=Clostridium sp. TaxID=1506 RepID=UPI0030395AFB